MPETAVRLTHLLALLGCAFASVPVRTPAAESAVDDRYWQCIRPFTGGDSGADLSGRFLRVASFDGTRFTDHYEMWGAGVRLSWRGDEEGGRPGLRVESVSVEMPVTHSKNGGGVYGYLFGGGELVGRMTLLNPVDAKKGYAASGGFFSGASVADGLVRHDIWTFVAIHADGTEIVRRRLPVADRSERLRAFLQRRAEIEAVWAHRNEALLETTPVAKLPTGGFCLLSTPESRAEMETGQI